MPIGDKQVSRPVLDVKQSFSAATCHLGSNTRGITDRSEIDPMPTFWGTVNPKTVVKLLI